VSLQESVVGRYLIVANQTLGGEELDRTVRDRLGRGDSQFFIIVPMTAPMHETDVWTGGFDLYEGMTRAQIEEARRAKEQHEQAREARLEKASDRAEQRLHHMIRLIEAEGGEADGKVGDADPTVAVQEVLRARSFDEIIISTLPPSLSRWLRMDLPRRVSRMTDTTVTTVEAADERTGSIR
jgi:cell pole-organizing protein PopZ